jgi:hypothetical protein
MAYTKRNSTPLEKAQARLRGLEAVDSEMDLGSGLTLQEYAILIQTADSQLQDYNTSLSESDRKRLELTETEAALTQLSSRILSAVAATYGRTSKEYEMAGGKVPATKRSRKSSVAVESRVASTVSQGENSTFTVAATNGSSNGSSPNGAAIASVG